MKIRERIFLYLSKSNKDDEKPPRRKRVSSKLKRNYQYRIELNLDQLKVAIDAAKMPDNPDRQLLYIIFDQAMKDSHLSGQMRTAVIAVQKSEFYLSKNNDPDDEATELLRAGWFDDFVSLALDAEFWGHSLVEFGLLGDDGLFTGVQLIPRINVHQEESIVVMDYGDDKGVDYSKAATQLALVEIGDPYSLGILELAAKEVIVKNYARTDWSQASEKYGMPLLKILTGTQDDKEIDKMEQMAANFASNGYVILSQDDEAEIMQARNSDFYKIYQENITLCDQQISKIINGQTGTSDEKAFVGSAEVHERLLDDYTNARLRKVQHIVNNKLIPFLVEWGYPLEGYKFQYADLLKKPDPKPRDPEEIKEAEKKKLSQQFSFPDWVMNMPPEM